MHGVLLSKNIDHFGADVFFFGPCEEGFPKCLANFLENNLNLKVDAIVQHLPNRIARYDLPTQGHLVICSDKKS